jgi:DNA repair and recombination protein RAD52
MFTPEQKAELSKPLNPAFVKQRSQAGRELSYIEGWHAISEANRIFGFDGWHRKTVDLRLLGEPHEEGGKWRVAYMARVRIGVNPDIVRDGCGFGSGIDRDLGRAHESALKEAETDAMKRALMTFGNQFGLALYDKEQRGVGVEQPEAEPAAGPLLHDLGAITVNGQPMSAYAARKDGRWEPLVTALRACRTKEELEAWTEQNGADIYDLPDGWRAELRAEYKDCLDHVVRGR